MIVSVYFCSRRLFECGRNRKEVSVVRVEDYKGELFGLFYYLDLRSICCNFLYCLICKEFVFVVLINILSYFFMGLFYFTLVT